MNDALTQVKSLAHAHVSEYAAHVTDQPYTLNGPLTTCRPAPTDWRMVVSVVWLNIDARIAVAKVRMHAPRARNYSVELLVGPDGHHALSTKGFADSFTIAGSTITENKEHPFTMAQVIALAMKAVECRCDYIEQTYAEVGA